MLAGLDLAIRIASGLFTDQRAPVPDLLSSWLVYLSQHGGPHVWYVDGG